MGFFSLKEKGFTLTELLVTCAILAILAGAILPLAQTAVKREKEIELRRALRTMREAIDAYKKLADEKKIEIKEGTDGYPPDLETLVEGVELKSGEGKGSIKSGDRVIIRFLRRIPKDPMTDSYDWGLLSSRDKPDSDRWGERMFSMFIRKVWGKRSMERNIVTGKAKKGFTLIELIIVFTLIGILLGLALPQYKYATKKAREAVLKEDLYVLRKLIDQYFSDKGKYPASLQTLVEEGYLRRLPVDPFTGSDKTWEEIQEQLSAEEAMAGKLPGVIDVRSGSKELAIDGTPYNTW